jgi:SAM-dependent methyltransferase
MAQYVLDHHLEGEKKRLALMSQLLDPMHRRHIESLGISRDTQVLDVGCGNGSMSVWMAEQVAPDGQVIALDLDLSLVEDVRAPGVEFRQGDIVKGPVDPGRFDLVTARAVLHHVSDARLSTTVAHAKTVLQEREIDIAWCEQVLNSPERVEPDPDEGELEHRLGRISEHGGRVLRVVVNKTVRPIRVVTLYFDRTMLRKL